MDESQNDVATKSMVALMGMALLALAAQRAFGDVGLSAVLALTVGALALVAFHRFAGRSFAGLPAVRRAERPAPSVHVTEDVWRSERWVREAAERGLRAMDEWRFDQTAT